MDHKRKRYTKPTMIIRPTDIDRIAQAIWFNDVPVYDPTGQRFDFWCIEEVENILCGPAAAWSLSPVGQANDSTASDEAQ